MVKRFSTKALDGWDALIAEAKQRIQDLEFSIKVFEQKKAKNELVPWLPKSDSDLIKLGSTR